MAARVGVIGCGHWGRNLVRNFAELGALAAVSDARPETQAALAARHGVPGLPVDELLADGSVEAVAIAAPAAAHADLTLRALAAGKHVFVEKPLALRVEDAERVVRAADAAGRTVMVGHLLQYHPAFLELRRVVGAGGLGRLRYVYSNRLNLGRFRREENVFWSFAPHDVSMILSLVGEEPDGVTATGQCYLHKTVADVTTTHLTFPSGVAAHVFVSWLHPSKEQRLVVVGERGMAVLDDGQPWPSKLVLYPHEVSWLDGLPEPTRADPAPVPLEPAEPLRLECRHFLDCVAGGARPRTDAREGLRVLRVLAAAEEALGRGHVDAPRPANGHGLGAGGRLVHPTAVVDPAVEIGAGTRVWHFSHLLGGTRIGRDCVIGQNVMIGPDVVVGDRCKIQNNVSLYRGVTLEDGVFCGPSCVFTNVGNPRAEIERKDEFRPTRVGRGATIGANATIVCGRELGEYCLVGAGAVVTRDVPPFALVVGNPARQVGWVGRSGERLGPDLACPRTGRRHAVLGGRLVELAEAGRAA